MSCPPKAVRPAGNETGPVFFLGRALNWGPGVELNGSGGGDPSRGGRRMRRYALRDDQWERIEDLLPGREGHVGVTAKNNRLFVEAVLYRYRAGIFLAGPAGTLRRSYKGSHTILPLGRE